MSKRVAMSQEEMLKEALVPVEEQPYEVPGNWVWVKLGGVVDFRGGGTPSKDNDLYWNGDIPWASVKDIKGLFLEHTQDTITEDGLQDSSASIAEPGELLLITRMSPGKSSISKIRTAINQDLKIVKPKLDLPSYFLWMYFNTNTKIIEHMSTGSTVKGIQINKLKEMAFPLPPLNEQKRIADKVERLLYKLEQAKELVVQTMENIDLNRKSVIVNAYLGKLTEEWRRTNQINESAFDLVMEIQKRRKDDYLSNVELIKATSSPTKNKSEPDFIPYISHEDSSLPKNWCITRILDLTECLDRFRKPVSKAERENRPGNIPYYGANGQVDTINDYIFNDDIVLVVEDETFTGREKPFSYIVRGKSWVNNHAHVLRPLGGIDVEYLNICLSYYNFIPLTSGSTGRRKLTQAALNQAPLRLAPLSEQKIIVSKVRKVHEVLDKIKQNCIITLERIECIKKSILNKALKGELGTYDHGEVKAIDLLIEMK